MNPGVYWRDLAALDWVGAPSVTGVQEVTTLRGSSGTIRDAVLLVRGPITNATVTDVNTGFSVRLGGALAQGQTWRVNVGSWATRTTSGGALGDADSAGTDATATTEANHPSGLFLPLTPAYDAGVGARTVRVSLTGSGTASTTQLLVRARKAYL